MSGLPAPWSVLPCELCGNEEGIWQLRHQPDGEQLNVGTDCLVDLALAGRLMQPDPEYETVYS